jgi:hypothetical protein
MSDSILGLSTQIPVAPRPNVTVEVKRYDDPDAWFFAHYTRCAWDDGGAEAPIFDNDADLADAMRLQWYQRRLDGVMPERQWAEQRSQLLADGYRPYPLTEVDDSVRSFIQACVVPIEWQHDLMDPSGLADRVLVWVQDNAPMTMADLANADEVRARLADPDYVWVV